MAKRKGLGRGIGALIPTAESSSRPVDVFFPNVTGNRADSGAVADAVPGPEQAEQAISGAESVEDQSPQVELTTVPGISLIEIDPNEISPNPRQPRTNFDSADFAELVHSVREFGVLQPVIVRPQVGGGYELVMGERRTRAAREAGLATIPALVRETADEDLLRDALLENLHRSELNPLEEASAYQQLMEDFGITQEQLAQRIGRSRPQISNTIRLLKLPVPVQQRVAAGVLSAGHARAILSVDDAAVMQKLADKVVKEDLSVRATEEVARSIVSPRPAKPKAGTRRAYLDDVADRLGDRLNTRVKIALGARKGQVTIEFATIQDLNRILSELGETGFGD